jgi:hypothetical protein
VRHKHYIDLLACLLNISSEFYGREVVLMVSLLMDSISEYKTDRRNILQIFSIFLDESNFRARFTFDVHIIAECQ